MARNTYDELVAREKYEAEADRPSFDSFDDYVAKHPDAESYRRWLTQDSKVGLVLVPCHKDQCGLSGDYYYAYIGREYERVKSDAREKGTPKNTMLPTGLFFVHVNDCDDAGGNKWGLTLDEARQELGNLKVLSPFFIRELADFGYETY